MSASGYTPILLYGSTTASNVPLAANLTTSASGIELAVNAADGKLFYKDSGGVVQVLASKAGNVNVSSFSAGTTGLTPNTATTGAVTLAGTLATTNGGTGLTSFTANGVVYASSTSALTTGSALTFNGGLGIGVASATQLLNLSGAGTSSIQIASTDSGGKNLLISVSGSLVNLNELNGNPMAFGIGNAEQMRLTSAGLGIGTSSPNAKLHVAGTNTQQTLVQSTNGGTTSLQLLNSGVSSRVVKNVAGALVFEKDAVDQATLDSSGNLGLGVTPSAWATYPAFEQSAGALWSFSTSQINLFQNAYYNGGYKYKTTAAATYYGQGAVGAGTHAWFNAPSGTAGTAITFTQAMTLDSSGYLVVGDTVTSARFKAALTGASTASITTVSDFGAAGVLSLGAVGGNNQGVYLGTGDARTGVNSGIAAGIGFLREASGWNSALAFYTNGTTDGSTTNRITERARIDSSGNLLVGTTSTSPATGGVAILQGTIGGINVSHASGVASGSAYMYFTYGGTTIGSISQSGTTAVLYNLTSDQRLKTNIVDAAPASALIDAIQVRQYDWKSDGSHQRYGFIAQELVAVAPEAVHQPADPEEMMAVDYSKLVPMLVKEIQSLRARVAQLESK